MRLCRVPGGEGQSSWQRLRSSPARSCWAAVLLIGLVALTPLAHASPADPLWIEGIYDAADHDDVVLAVTCLESPAGAALPVHVGPASVLAGIGPVASPLIPTAAHLGSVRARAPPEVVKNSPCFAAPCPQSATVFAAHAEIGRDAALPFPPTVTLAGSLAARSPGALVAPSALLREERRGGNVAYGPRMSARSGDRP